MMLHIPPPWAALAEWLAGATWRRLVVLGGTDVGKSSFCRFLGTFLAQHAERVWLLDTDMGQMLIGPPTCVSLGRVLASGELELERIRFVGEVNPAANIAGLVAASARLAAKAAGDRLVINTSGLITGPGVLIKRWKLDALDPDHIVAIGERLELAPLLAALPRDRVHRLPSSPAAQRKRKATREHHRQSALRAALAGCRAVAVPDAVVEDLHHPAPEPGRFRLCGLAGPDGEDRAIGLVRPSDLVERSELWTNLNPATIDRVRLGMISPDLGDLLRACNRHA